MLVRKATYFTPDLILDNDSLFLAGKLWMENPVKYFDKIVLYTKASTSKSFKVVLCVEHINSSSLKQVLEYFLLLKQLKDFGKFHSISVSWNVMDDDELAVFVEDLAQISELDINIIKSDVKLLNKTIR